MAEFTCGLSRHINVEEGVLFPTFEQMTGMTTGPTTVMRSEHVEIRRLMERADLLGYSQRGRLGAAEAFLDAFVERKPGEWVITRMEPAAHPHKGH